MKAKKWAPPAVVDVHRGLAQSVRESTVAYDVECKRLTDLTEDEWQRENLIRTKQGYLAAWAAGDQREQEELSYYGRLVSDERASEIWRRLTDIARELSRSSDLDNFLRDYSAQCWGLVALSHSMQAETPAKKRKGLKKVQGAAEKLLELVRGSPYFDLRWFIASKISGDDLSRAYYGTRYAKAMSNWHDERRRRDREGSGTRNDSHWLLGQYHQMTIDVILDWIICSCKAESSVRPIVTKMTGDDVGRNIYARLLYDLHMRKFGKAHWDLMSSVISVALDIPASQELTGDMVRKMVKSSSRKKLKTF